MDTPDREPRTPGGRRSRVFLLCLVVVATIAVVTAGVMWDGSRRAHNAVWDSLAESASVIALIDVKVVDSRWTYQLAGFIKNESGMSEDAARERISERDHPLRPDIEIAKRAVWLSGRDGESSQMFYVHDGHVCIYERPRASYVDLDYIIDSAGE